MSSVTVPTTGADQRYEPEHDDQDGRCERQRRGPEHEHLREGGTDHDAGETERGLTGHPSQTNTIVVDRCLRCVAVRGAEATGEQIVSGLRHASTLMRSSDRVPAVDECGFRPRRGVGNQGEHLLTSLRGRWSR